MKLLQLLVQEELIATTQLMALALDVILSSLHQTAPQPMLTTEEPNHVFHAMRVINVLTLEWKPPSSVVKDFTLRQVLTLALCVNKDINALEQP